MVDADPELFKSLTEPEYDFFGKAKDQVMLESKESMVSRGEPSPDDADALVLTFAKNVARRDLRTSRHTTKQRVAKDLDYPIFGK